MHEGGHILDDNDHILLWGNERLAIVWELWLHWEFAIDCQCEQKIASSILQEYSLFHDT